MNQHIRRVIASSKVYAEDDQQTINFGFNSVCAGVTEHTVLAAVKESEDKLQHIVKQFTQTLHNDRDIAKTTRNLGIFKQIKNSACILPFFRIIRQTDIK